MKQENELVQRIESHYVGEDCIQVMAPYKNQIAIFNKDGLTFFHNVSSHAMINKYLEDERRKNFPYSNIPTYQSIKFSRGKINFTNQIFDFETPYIRMVDGHLIESFAVRDNNQALLINRLLTGSKKTSYVTRDELEKLYKKSENRFILYLEDLKHFDQKISDNADFQLLFDETKILDYIERQVVEVTAEFRKYIGKNPNSTVGSYLLNHPIFLDFVEQSTKNFDINGMKFEIPLINADAIIVESNNDDMSIQYVETSFINADNYKVDSTNIPINKYTLEQLKYLSPIILKTKEPRIPLRLNPGVDKEDIKKAKQMIKAYKNNRNMKTDAL